MEFKNTENSFGIVTRLFHWVMALMIIGIIAVGLYMSDLDPSPEAFKLYGLHKAFGIIILGLAVLRVCWTLTNKTPELLGLEKPIEKKFAKAAHGLLYLCMFIMPLSGWAMSSAFGYPVSVFDVVTLPPLIEKNKELGEIIEEVHEYVGFGLIGLIVAHAGAALMHHIVKKDRTLVRMFKGK